MDWRKLFGGLCIIFIFSISTAAAQELFYKIYQFETPFQGHLQATFWNTYITKSDLSNEHFNREVPDKNLWAHSIEAEYGLTDHLELDAYADFESPSNGSTRFIRTHFSALYRFDERYDHFINVAIYGEYYIPNVSYSASSEAELRLILDKDLGDVRIVLNPTLSRYIGGDESKKLQPGISGGIYYRRLYAVQPGIEYYSFFNDKTSVIFPTINFNITPAIMWNIAAGFGLTDQSDKMLFKSILTFDMRAIRPAKLFRKHLQE
ncbi:MAG: hypothetical protein ACTHJ0_01450 [Flavipsychrobacter sp.]